MANWIWRKYNSTADVTYSWRQYNLKSETYYEYRTNGTESVTIQEGYASFSFNSSTGEFSGTGTYYTIGSHGVNVYSIIGDGKSMLYGRQSSPNTEATVYESYQTSRQIKGSYRGDVTSASSSAYPTNGLSGSYWYDTRTSSTSYSQGSYIGEVTAEETAFTDNARHSDGFWYMKDRPANVAPSISGSDEDLGAKINPFTKTFFVDDLDLTQALTVVVKLNNSIIRTIDNATRKENYTVDINQERFDGLTIDIRNTIEISVTDTSGATAVRRWYFTRINTNPTVTVAMSDLGEQNSPFSFKFTADDADGDDITVKIFIDDVQIADLGTVTRGQEQTYSLGKLDYSKITNGTHKIKIEVTDSKNARGYAFVDFSKNITFARYKFTKEVTAQASTIIVNLMAEIADGATVTIKVCNNALDTNPTWETVPIELHGQAYNFQNTTKTASQWGVGVEVRIDRGTATKDSYFYGFVGAFN